MRLEVLFGDSAVYLNSPDKDISNYVKQNYPFIDKNLATLEARFLEEQNSSKLTVYELLQLNHGHPAMMNPVLYNTYKQALSAKFQKGFIKHLKRRLLRAVILQEKTDKGRQALSKGEISSHYLNRVLLSRYKDFFDHIASFHRSLTDMEVRNVSDNKKPMLDYVLLRDLLDEKPGVNMSREDALVLALYDYYFTLSQKQLNRNAPDFFYFLTRPHAKALKQTLFGEIGNLNNKISIYILAP